MFKRLLQLALVVTLAAVPGTADAAKEKKPKKGVAKAEQADAKKSGGAQPDGGAAGKKKKEEKAFSEVIEDMQAVPGLFTFYRDDMEGKGSTSRSSPTSWTRSSCAR